MFKKRNASKKVNLNEEVETIKYENTTQQQPSQFHPSKMTNLIQQPEQRIIDVEMEDEQKINQSEINQFFSEIKSKQFHNLQIEEEINQINDERKEFTEIEAAIVLDDSNQIIVKDDYGEISPEEDSDESGIGYENQIIKKTLTKSNYMQLTSKLDNQPKIQKKNNMLLSMKKITSTSIQHKISKKLNQTVNQRDQMEQELSYLSDKISKAKNQHDQQLLTFEKLTQQFEQTKKILQYIYFYGNKVNTFREDAILELIREKQEGKEKVNNQQKLILFENEKDNDCMIIDDDYYD